MTMVYITGLGALLGWLVWNFVGEGGLSLGVYVLIGVAGALCGVPLIGYLGDPLQGTLGQVTMAPLCAFVPVAVVAFLDREHLE